MHLIRRTALRAASSPSTSFISSSRSIATSPFALRSKVQSSISASVFRRFNSDEASEKRQVESAGREQGSVAAAVESASTGGEAPINYEQRESRPQYEQRDGNRGGYNNRGGDRGDRGGRGGYSQRGGDRYGGNRDRGAMRSDRNDRAPLREYQPRVIAPSPSIYVGNLLFDITAKDLEAEFAPFGSVKEVVIATDDRGLSKGFAYVKFETVEEATAAIEAKNQSVYEGRRLICNYQNTTSHHEKAPNPPSKTLFIGNLAFEMSDADLNKLFKEVRNVIDVRVAIDRRTGQPRGFAHADFVDVESATKGKEALAGQECYGRKLRVDFSAGSREGRGERPEGRERY